MRFSRKWLAFPLLGAIGTAALIAALRGEVPRWAAGGTRMVDHPPLTSLGAYPITISESAVVAVFGDSNVSGTRLPREDHAFPHIMQQSLGGNVKVVNRGAGGDTAAMGLRRWQDGAMQALAPQLCIITYGTNDAAPRALLGRRSPVPLETYRAYLAAIIKQCKGVGAQVLVLAPPPVGSSAMDKRIQPYRLASRATAMQMQVRFLDSSESFEPAGHSAVLLNHDALHLNGKAHRLLGEWLADHIEISQQESDRAKIRV